MHEFSFTDEERELLIVATALCAFRTVDPGSSIELLEKLGIDDARTLVDAVRSKDPAVAAQSALIGMGVSQEYLTRVPAGAW